MRRGWTWIREPLVVAMHTNPCVAYPKLPTQRAHLGCQRHTALRLVHLHGTGQVVHHRADADRVGRNVQARHEHECDGDLDEQTTLHGAQLVLDTLCGVLQHAGQPGYTAEASLCILISVQGSTREGGGESISDCMSTRVWRWW